MSFVNAKLSGGWTKWTIVMVARDTIASEQGEGEADREKREARE